MIGKSKKDTNNYVAIIFQYLLILFIVRLIPLFFTVRGISLILTFIVGLITGHAVLSWLDISNIAFGVWYSLDGWKLIKDLSGLGE